MKSMRFSKPNVLLYGITHFNLEIRESLLAIEHQVMQDLSDSGFTLSHLIDKKIILDLRSEGHNDTDVKNIVTWFRAKGIHDLLVVFNAIVDLDRVDYEAFCVPTHLATVPDWFNDHYLNNKELVTDCKFLCMIRTPTHVRAQFASQLLQNNLDLRLSFGGGSRLYELKMWQPWFTNHTLPLIIDGTLYRDGDYQREFDITSALLGGCAVNVIVESSQQHERDRWSSLFITEKSFKAFAMLQIPIWLAVPGLVECVRNLGFDVFDDVVDHSYDLVTDQQQRMVLVLNEIQRLNIMDLAHVRQTCQVRLRNNCEKLQHIVKNSKQDFQTQIDRYINCVR